MSVVAPDFSGRPARQSGQAGDNVVPLERLQRSFGEARVAFKHEGGRTRLDKLHQSGCCKLRFPRAHDGAPPEAVLINTSGGLTDGDEVATLSRWGEGTCATLTTQAAERVYRSRGQPAHVSNVLFVEKGATALWLPQETILFDGGRLARRFEASLDPGATLFACESIVFGRTAMGETVGSGELFDSWRVRHGGRLVFADGFLLGGDMQARLNSPVIANGAAAIASIVFVHANAETFISPVRETLSELSSTAGVSVNGPVMVARLLARSGAELRSDMTKVMSAMFGLLKDELEDSTPVLPRVWSC